MNFDAVDYVVRHILATFNFCIMFFSKSQIEINLQAIGVERPSNYYTQQNSNEKSKKGTSEERGEKTDSQRRSPWEIYGRQFLRLTPLSLAHARTIFIALDAIIKRMTEERNKEKSNGKHAFILDARIKIQTFISLQAFSFVALNCSYHAARLPFRFADARYRSTETWLAPGLYFPNDIREALSSRLLCCCVRHFYAMRSARSWWRWRWWLHVMEHIYLYYHISIHFPLTITKRLYTYSVENHVRTRRTKC